MQSRPSLWSPYHDRRCHLSSPYQSMQHQCEQIILGCLYLVDCVELTALYNLIAGSHSAMLPHTRCQGVGIGSCNSSSDDSSGTDGACDDKKHRTIYPARHLDISTHSSRERL